MSSTIDLSVSAGGLPTQKLACERCGNESYHERKTTLAELDFACLICRRCGLAKLVAAVQPVADAYDAIAPTATPAESYCIDSAYRARDHVRYFDDTVNTDGWQREVYEYAQNVMRDRQFTSVYDIGCGSAYKLLKYMGQYDTCGFDVLETVNYLRQAYPQRRWAECRLSDRGLRAPDLVVCSDVIEHVLDPDELVAFIKGLHAKLIIFSTPDRDLVYPPGDPYRAGPPRNETHVREWNLREFNRYIARSFPIVHHLITNAAQATQMTLCLGAE